MKKRLAYLAVFFILLAAEICIGLFVRDSFIRPYVGDMLVTVLLCVLVRILWPEGIRLLPVWVFLFAAAVEFGQLLGIGKLLGLEDTVLGVIIGATFDFKDIFCYGIGCMLFGTAERLLDRKRKQM